MVDPTYPTEKDNAPPILEGGHDDLIGEPFVFSSEMIEDIQALSQPASSAAVGTLSELVLNDNRAAYGSLAGLVLATCRIQTGVNLIDDNTFQGVPTGSSYSNVFTMFCHFQEGKFSQPPFVFVQPFEDYDIAAASMENYHQPVQVDRVTTDGFRASIPSRFNQTHRFFWIAIEPPFGWNTESIAGMRLPFTEQTIVTNDPATPAWEDSV